MPRRTNAKALDLERIVEAASELIKDEGFDALTMRRLAERCGCTAMSLYRYVETKDDLLSLLTNRALAELELPETDGLTWQERISTVFQALHRLLVAHPEYAAIAASRPSHALMAYRGMEVVLSSLASAGLDDASVVAAYDTLLAYARGFAAQTSPRFNAAHPPFERLVKMQNLPEDEFGHVTRMAGRLVTRDSRHFDEGLQLILRGIAATASESNHPR